MPPIPPPLEFDPATDPFLALNQDVFEQVVTFVEFAADRFTLGFVSINFAKDCDHLLAALEQDSRCQDIQFERFHLPDPNLRFLRDVLAAALPQRPLQPDKKRVVVVTGLEGAIGMLGDYPMVLQDLNYVRDAFTTSLPHPLLICLPDSALARFAPDFWAWRLGVFRFHSLPTTVEAARQETAHSNIEASLPFSENGKAATLQEMAGIYAQQGEMERAIDFYQQVLQIYEAIGDVQGKAATLHQMAGIYANQGEVERALSLYQQSLQIEEAIGNVQGKAATLHEMAIIYAQQGEVERALSLCQQSMEIEEAIGNVQGKATTLHQMAIIYANQGEVERALSLYQQSMEMKEAIGNVRGKAFTLWTMGHLLGQQGDFTAALPALRESLQIFQHLRSPEATKVEEMLKRVVSMQALAGEVRE